MALLCKARAGRGLTQLILTSCLNMTVLLIRQSTVEGGHEHPHSAECKLQTLTAKQSPPPLRYHSDVVSMVLLECH